MVIYKIIGGNLFDIYISRSYNSKTRITKTNLNKKILLHDKRGVTSYECDHSHLLKISYTTNDSSLLYFSVKPFMFSLRHLV